MGDKYDLYKLIVRNNKLLFAVFI